MVKKVLHISSWYPSPEHPLEAVWIKRQIDALGKYVDQDIIHLQVKTRPKWAFKTGSYAQNVRFLFLSTPIRSWFLKEILTSILLLYTLIFKVKLKQYQVLNFHIAYPLCTYLFLFKKWIKASIVITEHWSAYRFRFGAKPWKKLNKIKRIFRLDGVHYIFVSETLRHDVEKFIGQGISQATIIPNGVDESVFKYDGSVQQPLKQLFMLAYWKSPKNPWPVLKAFERISSKHPEIRLKIGGFGPQEKEISAHVDAFSSDHVTFLGKLSPEEIAREMNTSIAFLHCSDYETFSVVCAEALCCGTPLVASYQGALKELIHDKNGLSVKENTADNWEKAIDGFLKKQSIFDRESIAEEAKKEFGKSKIGKSYFDKINEMGLP